MADTTFNIYFNGDGEETGNPSNPSPGDNPTPNPKEPTKPKDGKKLAGLATMHQLGKSALNYATSHVQMFTGSQDLQDKVNAGMGIAGTIGAIAMNPAIGLAMAAFNLATKAMDYAHKRTWENRALNQARLRAGPSLNRSRM